MSDQTQKTHQRRQFRPLEAIRAVRKVINDPEQTSQVFRVIHALSGPSLKRNFGRFSASEYGKRVLAERIDLVATLKDSEYLQSLPEHTLGNTYHRFITREQISAGGLEQASAEAGYKVMHPDMDHFVRRIRSSHDLFHVLTRYGRDPLGEACLLAYTYGQTGNIAFAFILISGLIRIYRGAGSAAFGALWRGYRDGKNARWMLDANWEELLEQPVGKVREYFGIPQPERYQRLFARLEQAQAAA